MIASTNDELKRIANTEELQIASLRKDGSPRFVRFIWVVRVGAVFFDPMIGIVVSPAMLGFAQSSTADLEGELKLVFWVSAIALGIALLLILTIPKFHWRPKNNPAPLSLLNFRKGIQN